MVSIWVTVKHTSSTAYTSCRAVARFRAVIRCTINLDQHGIINVRAEGIFYSIGVHTVAIRGELKAVGDSPSQVPHEALCCRGPPIPEHVRDDEFCVGIDSGPRPNITSALLHLFRGDVLLLGIDEGPNFIALDSSHSEIANGSIATVGTGTAHVFQELQNGMFGNSSHSTCGIYRNAFHNSLLRNGRQEIEKAMFGDSGHRFFCF